MSKKTLFIAIFLFISILGLSGCDPSPPPCDAGSLVPPELDDPDLWEILDPSSVVLNWHMDPACEPDQFEIILSRERDYSVIDITHLVSGDNTSWSPPTLDIAEEYFWRVAAIQDSIKSSYSFQMKSFFTEPICDPADLVMPSLLMPPDGGIFDRATSSLEWEWPLSTCIPEAYKVEVSMDPDFVDTTYFGGTGNPSTRWRFGSTPPGATQFWWRIIPSADEVYGPPSNVYSFFTDPVCTAAALVAPIRLTPLDEEIVTSANPEFTWDYSDPSCAPEGFHLLISTTPDMSTIVLDADNPTHASRSFQAGIPLDDCQTYYWHVAVVSEGVEGPYSDVGEFSIDTSGACVIPTCGTGDIPTPDLVWPAVFETVPDLAPSLQWDNPGTCDPEGYVIEFSHNVDFSDIVVSGATGTPDTSWGPSAPFEPGRQYRWHVAGMVGTTMGDFSSPRSFFTGPECTSVTEVVAPVLLEPENGSIEDSLSVYFHYLADSPICLPDGVFINLQTDPTFSGPNLLGEFSMPANTVLTEPPLTDCTLYFWKTAYIQDGLYGPESDVGWFSTNESGVCPSVPAPGTASKNAFCREGTFPEHFPAIYTIEEGDFVQVIARNPFSTYLLVAIPGADGFTPLVPMQSCWTILDAIRLWGPAQVLEGLEVVIPEPTPTPVPITCHAKLGPEDCKISGGTYIEEKNYCECP